MPVSYTSVLNEHHAVRQGCGLFDVSHMGEIFVSGTDATSFLNFVTINDVTKLQPGAGQYTAMLTPTGGMVDDLIMYQLSTDKYLLCVNASNIKKDYDWLSAHTKNFDVTCENLSEGYAQLAIQGPTSLKALDGLFARSDQESIANLSYMQISPVKLCEKLSTEAVSQKKGAHALSTYIARTGYTGEFGFEIYLPSHLASIAWGYLTSNENVTPTGLGARDTLRLEACYLLYGNDMDETVSPLEAGISWATKMDKGDFIGKDALTAGRSAGVKRKMIAFKLQDSAIARTGMSIYKEGALIGTVTSGSVLPTVGGAGGLALVEANAVKIGDSIEIDVRGKRKSANVVKKPLYSART